MIIQIEDILHTNNGKGEYRNPKVGSKYDYNRGRYYRFCPIDMELKNAETYGLVLEEVIPFEGEDGTMYMKGENCWYTTRFVGWRVLGECDDHITDIEIETVNSIYVCKVVKV